MSPGTRARFCPPCGEVAKRDYQRAIDAKRCAERRGARRGQNIHRDEVFERDGWLCWLCHDEIPRQAAWPSLQSATLDHVVPVSRGGDHSIDNLRAAHLSCNSARGNRLVEGAA